MKESKNRRKVFSWSEIKTVTQLELRGLYGWNKFRYSKDKKAKRRYLLLAAVWLLLAIMVIFYVGAMTYGLAALGLAEIVPSYLTMAASLLIFVFGIFKAGSLIFSKKGYDFLCSLPISQTSIVISRFLTMYAEDLMLTLAVMVPGMAVYGFCIRPGIGFYLTLLAGTVFIPVLPIIIAVAIGTVVAAVSSRMKHKTIIQTILTVAFLLIFLVGSIGTGQFAEEITLDMMIYLADTVGEIIGNIYLPALWLGEAAVSGNLASLFLFMVTSLAAACFTISLVSHYFHRISQRLFETSAKHNYRMGRLKSSSLLKALYIREAKRYFSSSIYVTNTIVGPIMAGIMSAAILIAGTDRILNEFPLPIDLTGLVPFLLAAVFTMMTTTSVSVSMEGKEIWIIKTLPVPMKTVLDSKILLNLSLMLPFYLLSEGLLIAALKPDWLELLWFILIPAVLILLAVVLGITVNLKLHSFDWEKEETVVKQSASAMLGGMAGLVLSVLCGALVIAVPAQWGNPVRGVICTVVAAAAILFYEHNNKVTLEEL